MNPEGLYRDVRSVTMPARTVRARALRRQALKCDHAQQAVRQQQINTRPSYVLQGQARILKGFHIDPEQRPLLEVPRSDLSTQTILVPTMASVAMGVYSSLHHLLHLRARPRVL